LRQLELIDEGGQPTHVFDDLRQTRGQDEYKACLLNWLQSVYEEILQFANPKTDPPARIAEAFRGFTPPAQRTRMVTLMLRLFEYAGVETQIAVRSEKPRFVRGPSRPRSETTASRQKSASGIESSNVNRVTHNAETSDLPPGLLGLLHQIPTTGASWTKDKRDNFIAAFTAVLDFSVPIITADALVNEEEDE
jgi:hypothetical protein